MSHGWKVGENEIGEVFELPDRGDKTIGRPERTSDGSTADVHERLRTLEAEIADLKKQKGP